MKNNRQIKFRIWDKKRNTFRLAENTALYFGYQNDILKSSDDENLVFQQFIGLLDINNKEIFEGDIIKVKNNKSKGIGEVIYSFDSFVIVNKCRALFPDNYFSLISGKIIGNILENPELLKNEN